METGTFGASWPGVEEIEITVAPDSAEALLSINAARKIKPHLPHLPDLPQLPDRPDLQTGLVLNGRVRQKPGAVHTTVSNITFQVSAGVFWQVHVGAAGALVDAVRSALGASTGDSVVECTPKLRQVK